MALFHRKWLIVALALLALIGGFVVYVLWPRADELARWKAQMSARGEKFTLAEVAPKFSQEKLDWAKQFQAAVNGIVMQPVPPGAVEMMVSATPGYAVPAWQRPFANEAPKTNHTWEVLAEQMAESGDALHELHELLRNIPGGSATDYSDPVNLPGGVNFVTLRRAAQNLSLATLNDLHRGSLQPALTNLHALIGLTRALDDRGLLVDSMIRVAIAGLGTAATWEALRAPGWDDAPLAALDAAWAQVEPVKWVARTFEMERAWVADLFQQARTNRGGPGKFVGGSSGGFEQFLNDQVVTPLWQKSWSQADELFYHRAVQPFGEGIRDAVTNRSWQQLRARLETSEVSSANFTALDEFRYPFSAVAIPNWSKALKSLMLQESQLQMARAAIAIERHRLKHGGAPDSLSNLVPEFLRETPVDYMTGRPLLYAVNSNGSFALYSAGEDGRDDDGLGDDVAWPQAGLPTRVTAPSGGKVPVISFNGASAKEAVLQLARQAGLDVRFQPTSEPKVALTYSMSFTNVTASEALEKMLHRFNLALVRGPKHSNHCITSDLFTRQRRRE